MSVMQTVLKQFVLPFGIWTSKFTNKNDRSVFFYKLINYIIFIVFKILRLNDSKLERRNNMSHKYHTSQVSNNNHI